MNLAVVCRSGQCLAIGAGCAERGVAWQDLIFSAGNRAKTRARLGQTAAAPPVPQAGICLLGTAGRDDLYASAGADTKPGFALANLPRP